MTDLDIRGAHAPNWPPPQDRPRGLRLDQQTVITIVGWLAAMLLAYGANDARVSVVEERLNRLQIDVTEIKNDVRDALRGGTR